ncbi:MAG: fructose-bisphosphatase class II family protein, partial [Candidatus Dormibacteraeota bacterium]|nr:fructose-bisphosphatase class II family protein [Candidatus Dormibacteraeota bacterium]
LRPAVTLARATTVRTRSEVMDRELTDQTALPPITDFGGNSELDLVRVTEACALACARLTGRGDQERVKAVAASTMAQALEELGFVGRVALGPRGDGTLSAGSQIGALEAGPEIGTPEGRLEVGVYPVEGASLVSRGLPNAISMIVAVEPDAFPSLPAVAYMEKVVVGSGARGAVDLDDGIADNLRRIAFARDCRVSDLTVAILDRPRHQGLIEEVRSAGARVLSLEDGDITAGLLAAADWTGVDAMVGFGGLQEALLAACAVRCLGGEMVCRLWPRNDEERILAGEDGERTWNVMDLARGDLTVAVTGITGGSLLDSVYYGSGWAESHSLVLSTRTRTARRITTRHQLNRPAS